MKHLSQPKDSSTVVFDQSSPSSPIDIPSSEAIARLAELNREHVEQNARRCVAAGRLVATAHYIREHPPETLSNRMKDCLLNDIVRYADEFLEGR